MATITKTYEFVDATTAEAAEVNTNFDTIYNEFNGSIDNANVKAAAAIAGSKLNLTSGTGAITATGAVAITGATAITGALSVSTTLTQTGAASLASTLAVSGKSTFAATVQTVTAYTPAAAGTATLDVSVGNIHRITCPAGNFTIAISNETIGQCFVIEIVKDATTTARTITWMSTVTWITAGGVEPTFTTTSGGMTTYGFRVTAADAYDGYPMGSK